MGSMDETITRLSSIQYALENNLDVYDTLDEIIEEIEQGK